MEVRVEAVKHQCIVGQIKWVCKLNGLWSNWGLVEKNSNCKLQSSDLTFSFFSLPWQLGRTASNVRSSYRPKRWETCVIITTQITVSSNFLFFSPCKITDWVHAHRSVIKYKLSRFRSNYLWRQKSPRGNPKGSPGAFRDLCRAIQEDAVRRSVRKSQARTRFSPSDTSIICISAGTQVKCQRITPLRVHTLTSKEQTNNIFSKIAAL